ncbi:hypothetical protein IW262DRAFT_1278423, partial [Armillaria fumosa]
LDAWYETNETALASAATALESLSSDAKSIGNALNSYAETAELVIQGLTELGQVHPFIGAAVLAFKMVVSFDMTRRENNKKVLIVKLQIQDMMIALFQLRRVHDAQELRPDGTTVEGQIGALMKTIANDIKVTASACNYYLKKGFLAKTIQAKFYENRLATYAAKFAEHRKAINSALLVHITLGVESANAKLDVQDRNLKSMERKLDEVKDVLSVFSKLDTDRERDIQEFIKKHRGLKACIDDERLLHELVDKSGEGIIGVLGQQSDETWVKAKDKVQIAMRKELAEDVGKALERNFSKFEKKLSSQIQENTESILTALSSGAHERISDDDLRNLWKDMGWKGSSVKAKHLILALHDYFTDRLKAPTRSSSPTSMLSPPFFEMGSPIKSPISPGHFSLRGKTDQWTLAYLNISHLQPILEAVDDDATGFITIKEINTFTNVKSRPQDWTLPQWIAYWAKGWHVSVNRYKKMIRMILSAMYDTFPNVLPANREAVAAYLQHRVIYRIDTLLQSTRDVSSNSLESSLQLQKLTEEYTKLEESRIGSNLADVQYEIDGRSTVSLITGRGRIERYIYPVLYLLLKHQLRVVRLSTRCILDSYEAWNMSTSLWNLFSVVDERIQNLASIFKQSNVDVAEKLENFAFGMFRLSYNNPGKQPCNNFISDYVNEDSTIEDLDIEPVKNIPVDILRYSPDISGSDTYNLPTDSEDVSEESVQGQWTGHLYYQRKSSAGLMQFLINSVTDGAFIGKAATWWADVDVSGNIKEGNKVYIHLNDETDAADEGHSDTASPGTHEADVYHDDSQAPDSSGSIDPESEDYYYKFILRRTPASLCRFLPGDPRFPPTPDESARSHAIAQWKFAYISVRDRMRRKSLSWQLVRDKFAERRRFLDLAIRERCSMYNYCPRRPLSEEEEQELDRLRCTICPMDSRYYYSFVDDQITRRKYLGYFCDSCEGFILGSRLVCLTCMNDSFTDTTDLCTNYTCNSMCPKCRGFVHDPSHVLLKFDNIILDARLRWIIPKARSMIIRIKEELRYSLKNTIKPVEKSGSFLSSQTNNEMPTAATPPKCRCCDKDISLPCWVCLVCKMDAYICDECGAEMKQSLPNNSHKLGEPLLRISDYAPRMEVVPTEEKLAILDKKFDAVDQRLAALENRVESRFTAIEAMLKEHFSSLAAQPTKIS